MSWQQWGMIAAVAIHGLAACGFGLVARYQPPLTRTEAAGVLLFVIGEVLLSAGVILWVATS